MLTLPSPHFHFSNQNRILTDLIAHPNQGGQDELEHHTTLIGHQVPHVLQDVVARPVEVAVAEVGRDEAVLELRVLLLLVDVQQAEPLARRSTNHDVNLSENIWL